MVTPAGARASVALEAVLFDFDGTLVDTKKLYIAAYQKAVQPFVRDDLTEDDILAMKPTSEVAFIRAIVAERDFDRCLDGFYRVYEELHGEHFQGVFDGVPRLLDSLRAADVPVGLVTGKSRRSWEITRVAIDSLPPFDVLVVDDDVRAPKPDPHGLEIAVAALGAAPERAVYVGDTVSDMKAARAAGLRPVAALWSHEGERRTRHLERIRPLGVTAIDRPEELLGVLGLA